MSVCDCVVEQILEDGMIGATGVSHRCFLRKEVDKCLRGTMGQKLCEFLQFIIHLISKNDETIHIFEALPV